MSDGGRRNMDWQASMRLRAESRMAGKVKLSPDVVREMAPEETQLLFHEMRVHQIELEMQNEELRQAKDALEASRARFVDLYDLAPVSYCSVNEAGLISQANLTLATHLRVDRGALLHQPFSAFVLREDQDIWYHLRRRCVASAEGESVELRMRDLQGNALWTQLVSSICLDSSGMWELRLALHDMSATYQLQEQLRASEARYLALLNQQAGN